MWQWWVASQTPISFLSPLNDYKMYLAKMPTDICPKYVFLICIFQHSVRRNVWASTAIDGEQQAVRHHVSVPAPQIITRYICPNCQKIFVQSVVVWFVYFSIPYKEMFGQVRQLWAASTSSQTPSFCSISSNNYKMYLSNLRHVFVQVSKYISPTCNCLICVV